MFELSPPLFGSVVVGCDGSVVVGVSVVGWVVVGAVVVVWIVVVVVVVGSSGSVCGWVVGAGGCWGGCGGGCGVWSCCCCGFCGGSG